MVNAEILIIMVITFCILGFLAATIPYKRKINERQRILLQAKKPKSVF
jgi:hypothetical protein